MSRDDAQQYWEQFEALDRSFSSDTDSPTPLPSLLQQRPTQRALFFGDDDASNSRWSSPFLGDGAIGPAELLSRPPKTMAKRRVTDKAKGQQYCRRSRKTTASSLPKQPFWPSDGGKVVSNESRGREDIAFS